MPIVDKNRIYDGWISLESGVDSGRSPDIIDPNQAVSAENCTFRGGDVETRPGFRKLDESFTNGGHCYTTKGVDAGTTPIPGQDAHTIYKTGIFQSAIGYQAHGGEDCLIANIGGRLFKIIPGLSTATVTELVLPTRNRKNIPITYMVQADKWLVVQDGESKPILYDGGHIRRSLVDLVDRDHTEIPVGTIMAFGMGRIVLIINDRDVSFGDLYGSHNLPDPADSLPFFTERNFIAEGFDAAIPFQQGVATGMAFFPQLDTSTGNGQLLVFSTRGANSFFLSLPREQWKTSQFQIRALETTGLRGHRSISTVNEDLWFRAEDGARTYRQARSEPSGWAHIPLSTNVDQFFGSDTPEMLKFTSSIYFDNRILITVSPYWNHGRVFHNGLCVVDFDILSSFGTKYKPTWEGHWTLPGNAKISQVVTGVFKDVTRAFVFGLDDKMQNQLYELSLNDKKDWDNQKIEWEVVNRAFNFAGGGQQSNPFTESELYDGDLWLKDVRELEEMSITYRPDGYPGWLPWKDSVDFQMIGVPGAVDAGGIPTLKPGFAPRQPLGKPQDRTDPQTKRNLRRGYEFQTRFQGIGHVVIDKFRLHAQQLVEKSRSIG